MFVGDNTASGSRSTVSGGGTNTASGDWTSIGSGRKNVASGFAASVGGGDKDTAATLVLFKIRYNAALITTPGWRVVHRSKNYEIIGDPINLDFKNWELHITGKLIQ